MECKIGYAVRRCGVAVRQKTERFKALLCCALNTLKQKFINVYIARTADASLDIKSIKRITVIRYKINKTNHGKKIKTINKKTI